mmetsp:Transcript_112661/g.318283  ORF Transcript_112661/g.318283 Transcript_112661/m.318283 type:complete len:639 (-) Transcript_112661:116-2032(-)|eukprot:CAMPEP_0117505674 /NCGR_PEP_ID=MMETSP0784-20121206/25506_1 /TAXON_ID=39447 /ORGANISM="" /LENGTH=638 /DNA_ID=CAMNT_0005301107 /DNA_START=79 /DNA_END=1995 /DNA_ORIENTATION=-
MVVVVSPPVTDDLSPVFAFADEAAWRESTEWKLAVGDRAETCVYVELKSEPSSVPLEEAAAAVRGARVVVVGPQEAKLDRWHEVGLDDALVACHEAGGIIAALGAACAFFGAWHREGKGELTKGIGLARETVLGVCQDKAKIDFLQQTVGRAHASGHEKVRGYCIQAGGAAFFRSGDSTRAEAIGSPLLEAAPIPKSESLGRVLKLRMLSVPDATLQNACGTRREERWKEALDIAAQWLINAAGTVVVSTGAGVSAESGIPTYRDEGGLWELYDQMEVSHIKGFARDPLKCWRFELALHQMLKDCGPNAAHRALADLERIGIVKSVVTQNVDGLHIAAGSQDVIELHGSETRGICMEKGCRRKVPYADVFRRLGWIGEDGATSARAPPLPPKKKARKKGGIYAELTDSSSSSSSSDEQSSASSSSSSKSSAESVGPRKFKAVVEKLKAKTNDPAALERIAQGPSCPTCQVGLLKPDAVYFGEGLHKESIRRAINLSKNARAFLIVGTSGQVAPACKLPKIAKQLGKARVIEVSPRETDLSESADLLLMGTAASVVPALLEAVQRRRAATAEKDVDATKERNANDEEATEVRKAKGSEAKAVLPTEEGDREKAQNGHRGPPKPPTAHLEEARALSECPA